MPIAVFLCESCGKPLNDHAVNRKVVELFAKSGADAWFTPESDAILPAGTKCPHCGGTKFEKETDIFDVWLESGASYLALIADEPDYHYPWPSDLYLEGGDQYRGWFQSSLFCAMGTHATPPYKGVVTPGWTLDEKGQAMSKSRGNDVDPVDISSRLGAEVVRLWVASVDFREDVVGSERLMLTVAENYRKIRNTFRYILGNIVRLRSADRRGPFDQMESLDQYMLHEACVFANEVCNSYKEFAFHKIYHRVNNFCIADLSAFYFDVLKDRLYILAPKSKERRSAQTAIWKIGETLTRAVAPIMSFTAEEIWGHLPKIEAREESVHLSRFYADSNIVGMPLISETHRSEVEALRFNWVKLRLVRDQVLKELENKRNEKLIGTGLEAQISVIAPDGIYALLKQLQDQDQLRYLFIVSAVTLAQGSGNGTGGVHIEVKKADGAKCDRCWNYSTHVGEDKSYPTVCERCSAVLKVIEGKSEEPDTTPTSPQPTAEIPDHHIIGDRLDWNAAWVDVALWTELPFWLMVNNAALSVECEGHEFPVSLHDDYFELFFGAATDSRSSVGYRGPLRNPDDLPTAVREAMNQRPQGPYMWRKCKTFLKVGSRCNEDVLRAAGSEAPPRVNEAQLYLSELCRAHIAVVNKVITAYRLATYDYFAFEVSPWDVPRWTVERGGNAVSTTLVSYRDWDGKPLLINAKDPTANEKPSVYRLIEAEDLRGSISLVPTPGELELLDALNLMERGDYSGAVRRVTTAIEVVVEHVARTAVESAEGRPAAEKFLKDTRMRFDERVKIYQDLTSRRMPEPFLRNLKETRDLRHRIVHGGYRIGPSERGKAQKAVDTGRWTFNWFENDKARSDIREKRIGLRSLGRDLIAGMFHPRITSDGVVLSPIHAK